MKNVLSWLLRPQWVVFTAQDDPNPELGLKIWGTIFALYKGKVYTVCDTVLSQRPPSQREFGESLHPKEE